MYDILVIGAGHAGCEAAYVSAKLGAKVGLISTNLNKVATLPCNPSMGGPGKGHLIREIGALGGLIAKVCDQSALQIKTLNTSKGKAVQSYRAQIDKLLYNEIMLSFLKASTVQLISGTVEKIDFSQSEQQLHKLTFQDGSTLSSKIVIIACGTFLGGKLIVGNKIVKTGGRWDEKSKSSISRNLINAGIKAGRLKTGTPARIARSSLDFNKLMLAPGTAGAISFSYPNRELMPFQSQLPCFATYTNPDTHRIIKENLTNSPIFSGIISEKHARSCPSLDRKVASFPERSRHPIFLEPEGRLDGPDGERIYIQGGSLAFNAKIQAKIIRSIAGLEKAQFLSFGYAVTYDYFYPNQLQENLESKIINNLFIAGQLNGTTGYEEAAAQGLMAGINAFLKLNKRPSLVLGRDQAYIGVLVEDLISKTHVEPYRIFTSRSEYRILLRNDNADLRLSPIAENLGLLDSEDCKNLKIRQKLLQKYLELFSNTNLKIDNKTQSLYSWLIRPEYSLDKLLKISSIDNVPPAILETLESEIKYSQYLKKEELKMKKYQKKLQISLNNLDYSQISGLRNEAKERLLEFKPSNLATASNLQGITPADLEILSLYV